MKNVDEKIRKAIERNGLDSCLASAADDIDWTFKGRCDQLRYDYDTGHTSCAESEESYCRCDLANALREIHDLLDPKTT